MKGAMRKLFGDGERTKLQKARNPKSSQTVDMNGKTSAASFPSSGDSVLASSPTLHDDYASTMKDKVQTSNGYWNGFDGTERRGSPDEEEPADDEDVGPPKYGFPPLDNEKDGFSVPPDIEDDDAYSHAAMSIRAEQILANAKKRLTVSLLRLSSRKLSYH